MDVDRFVALLRGDAAQSREVAYLFGVLTALYLVFAAPSAGNLLYFFGAVFMMAVFGHFLGAADDAGEKRLVVLTVGYFLLLTVVTLSSISREAPTGVDLFLVGSSAAILGQTVSGLQGLFTSRDWLRPSAAEPTAYVAASGAMVYTIVIALVSPWRHGVAWLYPIRDDPVHILLNIPIHPGEPYTAMLSEPIVAQGIAGSAIVGGIAAVLVYRTRYIAPVLVLSVPVVSGLIMLINPPLWSSMLLAVALLLSFCIIVWPALLAAVTVSVLLERRVRDQLDDTQQPPASPVFEK